MGKRILILTLAFLVWMAGCSSGSGEPASSEAATRAAPGSVSEAATEAASAGIRPAAEPPASKTPPEEEAAVTMGEYSSSMVVYTYYYSNIRANLLEQARQNGYTDENMADFWELEQAGQTLRELLKESAVQVSKEHAILYRMAEAAGTAPDTEADQAADTQVDDFLAELEGDEQAFVDAYLITPAQMKEVERRINLVNAYQEGVFNATEVTDEEALAAYEANKNTYETVTVRHILILADETMSEEQVAEAETKANGLLARIQSGEDIGELVAEFTEDPASIPTKGEYTFPRGQMVAEFEDWAFGAAVGDQGVVKTSYGYHVMELMAGAGYENVKEQVVNDLKIQKAQVTFEELPGLMDSADWVVADSVDALEP